MKHIMKHISLLLLPLLFSCTHADITPDEITAYLFFSEGDSDTTSSGMFGSGHHAKGISGRSSSDSESTTVGVSLMFKIPQPEPIKFLSERLTAPQHIHKHEHNYDKQKQ